MFLSFIKSQQKLISIIALIILIRIISLYTDISQIPLIPHLPIAGFWNPIIRFLQNSFLYSSNLALIGTSGILFIEYSVFAFYKYKK